MTTKNYDQPREDDGKFGNKGQTPPAVELPEATPTPAYEEFFAAGTSVYNASRRHRNAGVAAMREAILAAAPTAKKAQFFLNEDDEVPSLDFENLVDENGDEIDLADQVIDDLRDTLDEIGDTFEHRDEVLGTDGFRGGKDEMLNDKLFLTVLSDEGSRLNQLDHDISSLRAEIEKLETQRSAVTPRN